MKQKETQIKKIQLLERVLGFVAGVCSICNLIYCFVDAPSGISRIELITICLARQIPIFIPLVICGLIDFIYFMITDFKENKRD